MPGGSRREQREKGGWATFQKFLDNQAKEFGISPEANIPQLWPTHQQHQNLDSSESQW